MNCIHRNINQIARHGARGVIRLINRDDAGTGATEYLLLLAAIVLPFALLSPLWFSMIRLYTGRLIDGVVLPFP